MCFANSSASSSLRFREPFGRPVGLPETPGLNRPLRGGSLLPTVVLPDLSCIALPLLVREERAMGAQLTSLLMGPRDPLLIEAATKRETECFGTTD